MLGASKALLAFRFAAAVISEFATLTASFTTLSTLTAFSFSFSFSAITFPMALLFLSAARFSRLCSLSFFVAFSLAEIPAAFCARMYSINGVLVGFSSGPVASSRAFTEALILGSVEAAWSGAPLSRISRKVRYSGSWSIVP